MQTDIKDKTFKKWCRRNCLPYRQECRNTTLFQAYYLHYRMCKLSAAIIKQSIFLMLTLLNIFKKREKIMNPKIKTVNKEEVKKWNREYLESKFLELQEIAKDGDIIIQKQQYQIDLNQKQINEMKKAITIKNRGIKDLQSKIHKLLDEKE